MVEAQRNLEPRQKMQYLLYYLRGTPLQMAEGFPISTEGYLDVIDLLERKYGDKTVLGNTLLQDVIELASPQMKCNELQLFHDRAFQIIRRLRQVGPGYGSDSLMVQILLGKLPPAMKEKILSDHDPSQELNASDVLKSVRDHVSHLDRLSSAGINLQHRGAPTTSWSAPSGNFNQQNRHNGRQNKNTAPNNMQFYIADFKTAKCPFCNGSHDACSCVTYATATERIRRAQKLNLCFLCLEGSHWKLSCPLRTQFRLHRTICPDRHDDHHGAL